MKRPELVPSRTRKDNLSSFPSRFIRLWNCLKLLIRSVGIEPTSNSPALPSLKVLLTELMSLMLKKVWNLFDDALGVRQSESEYNRLTRPHQFCRPLPARRGSFIGKQKVPTWIFFSQEVGMEKGISCPFHFHKNYPIHPSRFHVKHSPVLVPIMSERTPDASGMNSSDRGNWKFLSVEHE